MQEKHGAQEPVQAVDRALQILEAIADRGPLTASEIARDLDVHRSTAFRLLGTLEGRRFVVREVGSGPYALGSGALRIAGAVTSRIDFAHEAQAICDEVTAHLGETSNVAILVDGDAVNIAQTTGSSSVAVRDQFVGQRTPAHATSSGKALLAYAGNTAVERAAGSLQRFSDTTITDPDQLISEMRKVRERGWGSALAEWQDHTNAVAVPVFASDGSVIAALSTTAPAFRMPEELLPRLATELRKFADELARRLGHRAPRLRDRYARSS
ncbi:IclR family transcriptional regulator [Leucobacter sp. GX24907]